MSTFWPLLRQRLRRDRWQLPVWLLGLALLALVGHSAVESSYGTEKDRAEVIGVLIHTPAVLLVRGTPQGTQTDAFQFMLLYGFTALLVGWMVTFLAVRHSRGDEEAGRAELVESTPAGRIAPLSATIAEGLLASLAAGVLYGLGFAVYGANTAGSVLAGFAMASNGVIFLGVGLLCAQLLRTSRGANATAATIVLIAYLLRGMADALGTVNADGLSMTPSGLMWFTPAGWGALTLPFSQPSWWPLLIALVVGILVFAGVYALRAGRDIDDSLVPERRGRAHAGASLSGPFGLTWRQLRNGIIGWAVGAFAFGAFIGGLAQSVATQAGQDLEQNLGETLGGLAGPGAQGDFSQLFVAAMFSIMGILAAAAGVQTLVRARQDEAAGTAETVLSAPVSRTRWFGAYLLLALICVVGVMLAGTVGALLVAAGSDSPAEGYGTIAKAAAAQLPAALIFAALTAIVFAFLPRWTIGAGWGLLLVAVFVGQFGALLGLPDGVRDLSPFSHTPVVTNPHPDWTGAWVMVVVAVVLAAASVAAVRRRDLALGA